MGRRSCKLGGYAASKLPTEGMMQVLAEEYQSRHLRVNCINPGSTRTKMRAARLPTEESAEAQNPGRYRALYLWLMGDDSRRKTGMTLMPSQAVNRGYRNNAKIVISSASSV
ncbi:SDR family NAD(P)-dependent oxidoreductase [Shigella flexneri]